MENQPLEVVVCPSFCPGAGKICEALPVVAAQGAKNVEVGLFSASFFDHRDPEQIDRLVCSLERHSLNVHSVHSPFGQQYDFSSFENKVHDSGVDAQIEAIEVARLLGAGYVVVHASDRGVTPTDRKKRLDRARGVLRELATLAEEAGVKLAVENLPHEFLCDTADELKWLLESVGSQSVGACFDTGHANITGSFEDWAAALLPVAITMHLHDNDGSSDQHRFPGFGNIGWRAFTRLYDKLECCASAALECRFPDGVSWRSALSELLVGC